MSTAVISGITGQDGAYLAKLLLEKGYQVKGLTRSNNPHKLKGLEYLGIEKDVEIIECDLMDAAQTIQIFQKHSPDEVFNLAAQSSVSLSFSQSIGTVQYNILSVLHMLEAIKLVNPSIRFYQASSSEMFGKVEQLPIRESNTFHPLSPYAISKASAHWLTVNYRESFGLYTACGILFNHESYLRSPGFFIKKVLHTAIAISKGEAEKLSVGNIDIKRDFGYAPAYVDAMWRMLQQDTAEDYLICSGQSITLRSIVEHVFDRLHIPIEKLYIDPAFYRPTDIEDIYGDPSKARTQLGWDYDLSFFQVLDMLLEEELTNYKTT